MPLCALDMVVMCPLLQVLHVRYCDLVRDQEGTTRSMLEHCSIPWEDSGQWGGGLGCRWLPCV